MALNQYFTDNLIVQHSKPFIIKGFVNTKSEIKVLLKKGMEIVTKTTDNVIGFFEINLGSYKPSLEPYSLSYFENNDLIKEIRNISFGEVILLVGQSNIAISAYHLEDFDDLLKKALELDIRYIQMQDTNVKNGAIYRPSSPLRENKFSKWEKFIDNKKGISGIGLSLAILIANKRKIPVGLIQAAVGGASIDSYLSYNSVIKNKKVRDYLLETNKLTRKEDYLIESASSYTTTSGIYNEKISPLENIRISSIIWYQGENSVLDYTSSKYYFEALKTLVIDYREIFKDIKLPIVLVNISENFYPYADVMGVNYINEAINKIANDFNGVYSIPIYDKKVVWYNETLGLDSNPIHPINKTFISERIFLSLVENVKSPQIISVKQYKEGFLVTIDNTYEGIINKEDFYGFQVGSSNKLMVKANAKLIKQNQLYVYSKYVLKPMYLSYGYYTYNYDANVFNSYNLPLELYNNGENNIIPFANYAFQRLNDNSMYIHYFSPILGKSGLYPIYYVDGLNNFQQLKLEVKNKKLYINHLNKEKKEEYFGPTFKINVPNIVQNLNKYSYIDITIRSTTAAKFYGILFEYSGQRYILASNSSDIYQTLKNQNITYTIDLNCIYNAELSKVKIEREILNMIYEAQLLFSSKENGEIIIKDINIY